MRSSPTRRDWLRATTTASLLSGLPLVHAGGAETLRVGLVGCGGRGTGAAAQALAADPDVRLSALADAFADRLQDCLDHLRQDEKVGAKVDVRPEQCHVGFDAYRRVIEAADVVLLCTPPQFRPIHLKAAVAAGKHVFAEKPVAVDAPGVRSVLETCAEAKRKGLSVVSGLCLRYDTSFRETVQRVQDGAIGEVTTLLANDYRTGRWAKPRQADWNEMTYQMRNWYNFTWLSGDFNVEQHVHFLDTCAWIMGDRYPVKAIGMGGRQVLNAPEHGNIYDHFSIIYEYENGTKLISNCRQQPACKSDLSAEVLGTKGRAWLAERRRGTRLRSTSGDWTFEGPNNQMFQAEHDALFASVRSGKPINNGEYMAQSTLLAILGRMAAYTGQEITWDMALASREDLSPSRHDWDGEPPQAQIAVPGQTKFV